MRAARAPLRVVASRTIEPIAIYRARSYLHLQPGRFTQPDPIGLAGGLNLYGYAGGDPVNFSDPFGLCCFMPGAVKSMVLRAATEVALREQVRRSFLEPGVSVGASVSFGLVTVNAGSSGFSHSVNAVPQFGASYDVGLMGRAPLPGESVVTGSVGISEHSGVSVSSTGDVSVSIGVGVAFKNLPVNVAVTPNSTDSPSTSAERSLNAQADKTRVATPRPK